MWELGGNGIFHAVVFFQNGAEPAWAGTEGMASDEQGFLYVAENSRMHQVTIDLDELQSHRDHGLRVPGGEGRWKVILNQDGKAAVWSDTRAMVYAGSRPPYLYVAENSRLYALERIPGRYRPPGPP